MELQRMNSQEVEEVCHLIQETIQSIDCHDYNDEQIEAWSSGFKDRETWEQRLSESNVWIVRKEGRIVGIASLRPSDHLDLLYVRKDHQHQGIAVMLLEKIEELAIQESVSLLYTEASLPALPFFKARGFEVMNEQMKLVRGISIKNYLMCKKLHT